MSPPQKFLLVFLCFVVFNAAAILVSLHRSPLKSGKALRNLLSLYFGSDIILIASWFVYKNSEVYLAVLLTVIILMARNFLRRLLAVKLREENEKNP